VQGLEAVGIFLIAFGKGLIVLRAGSKIEEAARIEN